MKTKPVYIITRGEYSDYRILGIYSSKKKAELALGLFPDKWGDKADIEEWLLDEGIDYANRGLSFWEISLEIDGTINWVEKHDPGDERFKYWPTGRHPGAFCACWAKSREHAVKIASDKLRIAKAQQ